MNDEEEEEIQSQGHFVHSQSASEEMHDEEEVEEEATWEIANQPRVSNPKKPNQQDENIEEVFQAENMELGQGKGRIPKEQSLGPRKETVVPSKKTNEIRRMRNEQ